MAGTSVYDWVRCMRFPFLFECFWLRIGLPGLLFRAASTAWLSRWDGRTNGWARKVDGRIDGLQLYIYTSDQIRITLSYFIA